MLSLSPLRWCFPTFLFPCWPGTEILPCSSSQTAAVPRSWLRCSLGKFFPQADLELCFLPISASQVARIIDVSHWHLAQVNFLWLVNLLVHVTVLHFYVVKYVASKFIDRELAQNINFSLSGIFDPTNNALLLRYISLNFYWIV
jgi:hypothetical protein